MKTKDVAECHPMEGQDGYLGEHKKNISKGHTPMMMEKHEMGTSAPLLHHKDGKKGSKGY